MERSRTKMFEPVVFRDGHPVHGLVVSGAGDLSRAIAAHSGHFAVHERAVDGSHLLVRDLLGVHKLFFVVEQATVESSNYLADLLRAGHPFESVFSVPAGHYVRVHPAERRYDLVRWDQLLFGEDSGGQSRDLMLARFASAIRTALDRAFRLLAERFAGRTVYVALSGGLDSTTIAALASEHFEHVRAVTFALRDRRDLGPGADLSVARRVARHLGLPHLEVIADSNQVLDLLDDVLVYGQDYRDFNVHCGLVNAVIARAIGALHCKGPPAVILTGDVMNELLADYVPVHFRGRDYFRLPSLDPGVLRRFLVGGLDSGDREVGIFARFGVQSVQPFALCAKEYAALPATLACEPGCKSRLVRFVMDARIPEYVHTRPKVRAQVAVIGEAAGTLALLESRGIKQSYLKERFAKLLGLHPRMVDSLTRGGYYRFSTGFPEASPHAAHVSTGSTIRRGA